MSLPLKWFIYQEYVDWGHLCRHRKAHGVHIRCPLGLKEHKLPSLNLPDVRTGHPFLGNCWDFELTQYTLLQQFFSTGHGSFWLQTWLGEVSFWLPVHVLWFLSHHHQREHTFLERTEVCQGPLLACYVAFRGIRQAIKLLYFDQLNSFCFPI